MKEDSWSISWVKYGQKGNIMQPGNDDNIFHI